MPPKNISLDNIPKIISLIKSSTKNFQNPIVTEVANITNDPFKVLISCLLSLRTKDAVTAQASKRLFEVADAPEKLVKLDTKNIEKLIYPVGFYKTKAKRIKEICKILIDKYNSKVPDSIDELLKFKGVGRKTAGIVMCYGHNKTVSIPVDSHVHQISNRLGWVKTKTPEQTEQELMKIIPRKYWHDLNDILVTYGQNICVPVSPFCSKCVISKYCPKIGIMRNR